MINPNQTINGNAITEEKEIEAYFSMDQFSCAVDDYWLEVEFSEERGAFIGWGNPDEEIFYFDNGSGNTDSVDLIINVCPEERMMCYDPDVIKDIVNYFCETGLRNPNYNWIEDTF